MSKKIIIEVDKEGLINIDADGYRGSSCEKSKILNQIINYLQKEGEIDDIKLKYTESETVKEENTISIIDELI